MAEEHESYESLLELDGGPSDPRYIPPTAPVAPTAAPTHEPAPALPSLGESVMRLERAGSVPALESIAQEIARGPVGALPREHAFRAQLRGAYQARLGVLIAVWWATWLKLWDGVGNAHRLTTNIASGKTLDLSALPPLREEPAPVAASYPGSLGSALGSIAAESAGNAAAKRAAVDSALVSPVSGANETRGQVREAIRTGGVVAVAGAIASGVGLGWDGYGEMTHAAIVAALASAGLPAEWAPAIPSARSILGMVMADENRSGNVARPERGVSARSRTLRGADGMPSRYSVRWSVMAPGHGEVGEAAGSILATVALLADDSIYCDGNASICQRVRSEYERRIGATVYEAGQVTAWLQDLMRCRLGAIRYLGWYVPARFAGEARALVAAMAATGWGSWPANPPMPMITCEALAVGLTRGLESEVSGVLSELAMKRAAAYEAKRTEISPAVAATLLVKLRDLVERTSRVRDVIGGEHVAQLRARLVAAAAEIEPIAGDMTDGISALRFANLELA